MAGGFHREALCGSCCSNRQIGECQAMGTRVGRPVLTRSPPRGAGLGVGWTARTDSPGKTGRRSRDGAGGHSPFPFGVAFRWMAEGASPGRPSRGAGAQGRSRGCFLVPGPWGAPGQIETGSSREGVNKQQVIKHDKR